MASHWRDLVQPTLDELERRTRSDYIPANPLDPQLPLGKDDLTWLRRCVDFEAPDLTHMNREAILARFPTKSHRQPPKNPPVNDSRLLTTLVWQVWLKIKAGEVRPIRGNVRTFWYRHVEGFYRSRHLLPKRADGRSVGSVKRIIMTMCARIFSLVFHRIFRYRDEMDFQEPIDNKHLRGRQLPGIVFHTEKEGLWWLCESMHGKAAEPPKPAIPPLAGKSISVMASNGEPSYLTLEYFAQELHAREIKTLRLGSLCDYDPWGYCIAAAMDTKLRRLGFDVTTWTLTTADLINLDDFDPEEVTDFTDLLKDTPPDPSSTDDDEEDPLASLRGLVKHWFELTGGIDGKPLAVHIDKVDEDVLKARCSSFFRELISGKTPKLPTIKPGEFDDHLEKKLQAYLMAPELPNLAFLREGSIDRYGYLPDAPQGPVDVFGQDDD